MTLIKILPKKIYRWYISIWKDAPHHISFKEMQIKTTMIYHSVSIRMAQFSQFSCSVMSHSLRPHGLQHARLPCPLPTTGAYSNLCPLSRWCHPTISSSAVPFSSWLQFFPASGSFPVSWFKFRWSKYWSFSFSISPSNEYSGLIPFRIDRLELY